MKIKTLNNFSHKNIKSKKFYLPNRVSNIETKYYFIENNNINNNPNNQNIKQEKKVLFHV